MKRLLPVFVSLWMSSLAMAEPLASYCSSLFQSHHALLLMSKKFGTTSEAGMWVEKTSSCSRSLCFSGTLFDVRTNEATLPMQGLYRNNYVEFVVFLDPNNTSRNQRYIGDCDRNGASGTIFDSFGRNIGTFYLSN